MLCPESRLLSAPRAAPRHTAALEGKAPAPRSALVSRQSPSQALKQLRLFLQRRTQIYSM